MLDELEALSPPERRRIGAFRRPEDAVASLLARSLMTDLAAGALGCPAAGVRLEREPSGRPYVAEPVPAPDINAAHAGAWIAAAVAAAGRIGIDVEPVRPVPEGLVARCLAPSELAALAPLPPAEATDRFFRFWTAKEAYLKATGLGLSVDPRAVAVAFDDDGQPALRSGAHLRDDRRWRLRAWEPEPGVWLTVCADNALPERLEYREAPPA